MLTERPTRIQRDIEYRVTNGLMYERMFEAPDEFVSDLELQMHLFGMNEFAGPYHFTNQLLFEAILDIITHLEDMDIRADGSIQTPEQVMGLAISHAAKMLGIGPKRMFALLDTDNLEFVFGEGIHAEISSQE